jgi:hypothetical protein
MLRGLSLFRLPAEVDVQRELDLMAQHIVQFSLGGVRAIAKTK